MLSECALAPLHIPTMLNNVYTLIIKMFLIKKQFVTLTWHVIFLHSKKKKVDMVLSYLSV